MQGRLVAVALVVGLALPSAVVAEDSPWTLMRKMFHEPATELKQGLKQLRVPAPQAAKPKAARAADGEETAKSEEAPKESATKTDALAKPQEAPKPDVAKAAPVPPPPEPRPQEVQEPEIAKAAPTPPQPKPRPQEAQEPEIAKAAPTPPQPEPKPATDSDEAIVTATAPIPRARPAIGIPYATDDSAEPDHKSTAAITALSPPKGSLILPPPAARSTCGAELAKLGVEADAIAPISEGSCGIAQPVAVASLGSGAVDLTAKAIIECNLAETFANWLRDEVQPEAQKILGGEVTGLRIAASYHCRSRNGVSGAKLSEHGRGNAIDISAFKIEGRGWIEVGGVHLGAEGRFLKTIRASACGPFTTVLGPGSDAYHSDHFHLDLATRNKRGKSRGLYCH